MAQSGAICYPARIPIHLQFNMTGPAMKYRKHETKEYAKQVLHGV